MYKNAPLKKSKKTSISSFFKHRKDRIKSDPNYFFKYAKNSPRRVLRLALFKIHMRNLVNDKKLMSDLLLNQFSSVFTTPSANHVISDVTSLFYADEHSNLNLKPKLTTINFTKEDVKSAIKSLKINSAPGPDGMTGELLTNCASVISEPLSALFTKSLNEGSVPTLLINNKRAVVVPIYKGGDRSLPSNYRPVSLTPILMKVVEKIIRENIVTILIENNLFNQANMGS